MAACAPVTEPPPPSLTFPRLENPDTADHVARHSAIIASSSEVEGPPTIEPKSNVNSDAWPSDASMAIPGAMMLQVALPGVPGGFAPPYQPALFGPGFHL